MSNPPLADQLNRIRRDIEDAIRHAQAILHNLRTGLEAGAFDDAEAVELIREAEEYLNDVTR